MDIGLSLKLAWRALMRNPLRATLTMLGVIIGVGAVVATLAIGQGARASVQAQIASLGSNVIMVIPGTSVAGGTRMAMGTSSSLDPTDVEAIRRECPSVDRVSWTVRSVSQLVYGNQNWGTSVTGATADYFVIRDWNVGDGAAFTDGDVRNSAKVVVLGATVADNLFEGADPIGQTIRIGKLPFKVVGVLERKGGSTMGQDQDDLAIAPATTVQRMLLKRNSIGMVFVSARSAELINPAIDEITSLLRQRHRIRPGDPDDFFIRNQAEFANAAEQTSRTMTLLLSSVAAVSLLVGGIGIMNIMLVSVTERTREIGIRMAVGARGRDILSQFLVESAFLSLLGGALGVALGFVASNLISQLARWPTIVSPGSVMLAFGFAAAVGIFFGFYPARKASQQDPIEALRYE
ncbi:MAG: ABC transporter permease [Candidatus Eiseniibacteriota bacterium]